MSSENKEKFFEAITGLKELTKIYLNKQFSNLLTSFILKTKKSDGPIKNISHPELIASFEMLANLAMSARELLTDLPASNIQKEDLLQLEKYHSSIFHLLAQSEKILQNLNENENQEISITMEDLNQQPKQQITNTNNLYKILSEDDMNNTISNFLKKK